MVGLKCATMPEATMHEVLAEWMAHVRQSNVPVERRASHFD